MTQVHIKPVKTEADYEAALERIDVLMDAAAGTPEADELEVLAALVELYEETHYPIGFPDPVAALRFRMEQAELSPRDLTPYIGSRSKVSEVLAGKRPLTLQMIRGLHKHLGIPSDVLLQEPGASLPTTPEAINWSKFPVQAMAKLGWFKEQGSVQDRAEEVMRSLIERAGGFEVAAKLFCRKGNGNRQNNQISNYALQAWGLQLMAIARENPLPAPYKTGSLTAELVEEVVHLSGSETAPRLAQEYLAQHGIHLIYLPHLPRTHLDGAALRLPDGTPVVGLTLRYDRLDNFWFSLCHELAHQALHLEGLVGEAFFDDLSFEIAEDNEQEHEADVWAKERLISSKDWAAINIQKISSPKAAIDFAQKLRIHPAIVAGRVRKETGNYRLLTPLIRHGKVRRLFT
jgi:HTH-type transcriptional regulator / antitoxin HigA